MAKSFRANYVDWLALVLVVVGAINWGLVGLAHFLTTGGNWNLVNLAFGSVAWLEFGTYFVVGLAGLYGIYFGYRLYTARDAMMEREPEKETVRRPA